MNRTSAAAKPSCFPNRPNRAVGTRTDQRDHRLARVHGRADADRVDRTLVQYWHGWQHRVVHVHALRWACLRNGHMAGGGRALRDVRGTCAWASSQEDGVDPVRSLCCRVSIRGSARHGGSGLNGHPGPDGGRRSSFARPNSVFRIYQTLNSLDRRGAKAPRGRVTDPPRAVAGRSLRTTGRDACAEYVG